MRVKNAGFILATVLLICVIAFCAVCTVKGQDRTKEALPESWYREQEAELLKEMRGYLNDAGYRNSGVTLTRVVDGEGNREYTFTIHHAKIDRMEEKEREELRENLARTGLLARDVLADNGCDFRYEFLHDICAK